MKKRIISFALIFLTIVLIAPFLLSDTTMNSLKDSFSIIGGVTSFIVMIIAILLYDKYGIDKTIKEKNLDVSLKLLEEIKRTTILFKGKKYTANYQVAIAPINYYEYFYGEKLLFSKDYFTELKSVFDFSKNLYLPKDIRVKLDVLIPTYMTSVSKEKDIDKYAKVTINNSPTEEYIFNMINGEEVTLYNYLIIWDELITTIQEWCEKNSDSDIDLNIG